MKSVPIEKLALQFSLANEQIDSTLCGTASVDELEKNISWVDDFENNGTLNDCV
jgi:aryl-alcohol dehydrogenase-like predicted oxidoreductase